MKKEMKQRIEELSEEMDLIIGDRDVPRNVKEKMKQAKGKINQKTEEKDLNMANAIHLLNEASEDINIPFHIRTDIMNITSRLEELNEEIK